MGDIVLHMSGIAPLVVSSDRGVNPLDPLRRELDKYTSKRSKTDDDHAMIARLEFELRLYWDQELGPFIPTGNVHKALVEGARQRKLGKKVEQGVMPLEVRLPLLYEGPRDIEGLFATGESGHVYAVTVGVNNKRTMRTRPMFREWALNVPFYLDEQKIDVEEFRLIAETTGHYIGIGERRPNKGGGFGRFNVVITSGKEGTNGNRSISADRLARSLA